MPIIKKEDFKCPGYRAGRIIFWKCKWIFQRQICMHPDYLSVAIPFCPTEGQRPKKDALVL